MPGSKLTRIPCTWADAEVLYPGVEALWKKQSRSGVDVCVEIVNYEGSNNCEGSNKQQSVVVSEISFTPNTELNSENCVTRSKRFWVYRKEE